MKYIFFVLLLFILKNLSSQSITINYNSIILGPNSGPYEPAYEYSYGQGIYLENDIQGYGAITGLTYYYSGTSLINSDSIVVYIGITDQNHLDSVGAIKSSAMTSVFQGKLNNYTTPGPVFIPFQTPFLYNGDSNLVIGINEIKPGYEPSFAYEFLCYTIGFGTRSRGKCWGNILPWNLPTFDLTPGQFPGIGTGVPKVTFHGLTRLPCQSPKLVGFSNITHNSARITWSPPDSGNVPIGYDIYYAASRYKPSTSTITPYNSTDTSYLLTGLTAATWYYAWVRTRSATCSSVWSLVDSFKTICAPTPTPTPVEPFGKLFPPTCWQRERGLLANPTQFLKSTTDYWQGAPYKDIAGSDSAAKAFIRTDTLRHWLISPPYDLGTAGNKNLEFDAAFTKNGSPSQQGYFDADDKFVVVISTDEGITWSNANTLRAWASPQVISSTGIHYILPLNAYTGNVRIGFYIQSTSGNPVGSNIPTLFIDNVKISEVLPVKLLEFTGTKKGSNNLLQWRTATEQNNRGFELQRSIKSIEFSTIGFVPTKANNGNSTAELSYNYKDNKPLSGGNYYRLKQVDFDGKFTYSNVVFIKGEAVTELALSALFPNPTHQLLNVIFQSPKVQQVQLIIADIAGKTVQQQTLQLVKGENNKTVNVAALSKGTYIIKLSPFGGVGGGLAAVSKFVKE